MKVLSRPASAAGSDGIPELRVGNIQRNAHERLRAIAAYLPAEGSVRREDAQGQEAAGQGIIEGYVDAHACGVLVCILCIDVSVFYADGI